MATAAQIAQLQVHRFIAQAAGKRVRAKPGRAIKPLKEPLGLRTTYLVALRKQIAELQQATNDIIVARLPRIISLLPSDLRLDAPADEAFQVALQQLEAQTEAVVGPLAAATLAERIARDVSTFNRRQFGRQMELAIGIDPFVADPNLASQVDAFVAQNVALIKSLRTEQLGRVESIVLGGLRTGARVETVRKQLRESFGISRRRAEFIATDQVNKLNGQLTRSRQQQVGITEYRWSTSRDERVRPTHRALEGTIQKWSDPPVVDPKTGRQEHPRGDYRCLPGSQPVSLALGVERAFRRAWSGGPLTRLVTEGGVLLEATANHPVLTAAGWKPAHLLDVGDDVFCAAGEGGFVQQGHVEHPVSTMEEVFDAALLVGMRVHERGAPPDFHGDGSFDHEVDIVEVHGELGLDVKTMLPDDLLKQLLAETDVTRPSERAVAALALCLGLPSGGEMGRLGKALAFLLARLRHPEKHRAAPIPDGYALALHLVGERLSSNPELLGERLDGPPGEVEALRLLARILYGVGGGAVRLPGEPQRDELHADRLLMHADGDGDLRVGDALLAQRDRVVDLSLVDGPSHVFNLQTSTNWYDAGLIVHNCRCDAIPVVDDLLEQLGVAVPLEIPQSPRPFPAARRRRDPFTAAELAAATAPFPGQVGG